MPGDERVEKNSAPKKPFGFPQKYRLAGKSNIDILFKGRKFRRFGLLSFKIRENTEGHLRFVISVSKKHGNAVRRNRIKRFIREAARLSGKLDDFPYDCAIYVITPPKEEPTLTEIRHALEKLFSALTQ